MTRVDPPFTPSREAGLARLAAFVPAAGRAYAGRRNTDYGPQDRSNVSVLSPFIRHRLIEEEEVLSAVLARHSLESAEKFVQEVLWRTYFKGHLETRPQIWMHYRQERDRQIAAAEAGGGFTRAYRAATEGRTGIECFDAWVEELVETGYLHNHARMWFASIWIFTLRLPWELGADFTFRHFVDGDPASNTLSWRWVGGLHTKGKTYLARPDNITAHTGGRFRPTGLAREAPPLDEPPIGPARALPAADRAAGPVLLLLTEDDLHPETLDLSGCDVVAVVGGHATADRSPLPVAPAALAFADGAVDDGLARAARHFAVPADRLERLSGVGLRDQARRHRVTTIAVAYPPVGPAADALAEAQTSLARDGIRLARIRRPLDDVAWPRATRGFFALKEHIPDLLRERGLA